MNYFAEVIRQWIKENPLRRRVQIDFTELGVFIKVLEGGQYKSSVPFDCFVDRTIFWSAHVQSRLDELKLAVQEMTKEVSQKVKDVQL